MSINMSGEEMSKLRRNRAGRVGTELHHHCIPASHPAEA